MRHTSESPINFFIKDTGTEGVWNLPYTFLFSLLIMAVWGAAQLLGMYLGVKFNPDYAAYLPNLFTDKAALNFLQTEGDILWPTGLVSAIVGVLMVVLFVVLKKGKSTREYLDLHKPKFSQLILWLGILVGFVFIMDYVSSIIPDMESDFVEQVINSTSNPWLFVLSVGVAVPIFEEFLFRGFLFKGIESASNSHVAGWTTAILFALIHVQ